MQDEHNQKNKSTTSRAGWLAVGALGLVFAAAVASVSLIDDYTATPERKLINAAESGNVEALDTVLSISSDLEDWADDNALFAASENGHLDTVERLVTSFDFTEDEIYRAAAKAADGGHIDVIEYFILQGLDVNSGFVYGSGLVMGAVRGGLDTVNFLLEKGLDVTNPNTRSSMALGYALQEGYSATVIALLDAGMDVHTDTYRGNVLSGAVIGGYKDIVEIAFEYDADIAADNHDATRKAAQYGYDDILDVLMSRGGSEVAANEGYALRAASNGDISALDIVVERQPKVLETQGGRLMAAAAYGNHKAFVQDLLDKGLSSAEYLGSAVIFAAQDGYDDLLALLLDQEADFSALEYDALNEALFYATQNNHADSVKLLLAHGADPRVRGEHRYAVPIDMTENKRKIKRIFDEFIEDNPVQGAVPARAPLPAP